MKFVKLFFLHLRKGKVDLISKILLNFVRRKSMIDFINDSFNFFLMNLFI